MNSNFENYFPERFVNNRQSLNKIINQFLDKDWFKGLYYSKLKNLISEPIPEWNNPVVPNELLIEKDKISKELKTKYSSISKDSLVVGTSAFEKQKDEIIKSDIWKKWEAINKKIENWNPVFPRLEEETRTTKTIIDFYKSGRNIFSISPFLIKLLNHTDVGNVKYEDVKLPYNSLYLHFGAVNDYDLTYPLDSFEQKFDCNLKNYRTKNFFLEGAFITMHKFHALDITLTFVDINDNFNSKESIKEDFRFPTINFLLDFDNKDIQNNSIEKTTFNNSKIYFSYIWENSDSYEIEYGEMQKLIKDEDKCYGAEWVQFDLFDRAIKLIVNSICYLNYVNDDKEFYTTNDSATDLINELQKTKKRHEKFKLEEKLKKLSYSKIHYFGRKIEIESSENEHSYELEPHWRRGHWRNQAIGQGLIERKLIWIKPTIVRKDKGEPEQGHIYEV